MKYKSLKKGSYLAIRVIVPCYYYNNLLTYALNYTNMVFYLGSMSCKELEVFRSHLINTTEVTLYKYHRNSKHLT